MARAAPGSLGGLPLRRGDGLSGGPGDTARPRFLPLLVALALVVAIVGYGVPLAITGDPLWPLPAATDPDTIAVHWEGRRTVVRRGDPRHDGLRGAINEALSSIDAIEYRYGVPPEDFARLRSTGRAVEASYGRPAQAHGSYAIGPFTRLFVSLEGDEYARGLIFVGQESGYRSGPLRSRKLPELREIAERVAAER